MTARFFNAALGCKRLKPSPRPLTCHRAKNAMYATHRLIGALRILKSLCLLSWRSSCVVGTLRRMPSFPKDAKNCVCIFWHSSALRQRED
jgi:hypothetical protein